MPSSSQDLYQPKPAEIREVIEENSQIKTFDLSFVDREYNDGFSYEPGQFMMVSIPHCGEAPISVSSTPLNGGTIHLSVRRAGKLTEVMHEMKRGDVVGLRGPYGRPFPMASLSAKDLLFVAGGIGLAPLRSVINTCLAAGHERRITILYGSRTPSDIAFKEDLASWGQTKNVTCLLTVDRAEPGWEGEVGLVTALLAHCSLDPHETKALLCGPPMMIRAVLAQLADRGFADGDIITTMERHMKCGVGICRHCHMDDKLVCKDGPVFTLEELKQLKVMELQG
ncbi:MAG: FAD/NAD(P)-binding protein [Proteobacteria bacterium]|nr:FAD/NAD(P)-binding protein [Pseudomonadota bacterium]MBU4295503.1 FAD/NAD(P)-binding protein [Pseudomonadota bacterium]MCG2749486.1 FAD/NAD(P)-binding protein [Desulfobulbaceae bacterium]